MKVFSVIVKILVALAAIAGAVYVAATYGDKIVAWAKKLMGSHKCCCGGECDCGGECECGCEEAEAVEEAPAEVEAEEELPEEPEVEIEVIVAEGEPVAEEHEFEA